MIKITKFITLFSLSFAVSGCLNSAVMPQPVLQTHTNKVPHQTRSLGTLISTSNEESNKVEEVTTVFSRADEDEYREEEEIYPTIEESMEESATEESPEIVEVTDNTQSSKTPETINPYGEAPENYRAKIRNYLAKKANPSYSLKYIFSRPQKAYKNNRTWKGWMVQVDVLKRNGKGEVLKSQPYTILFKDSTILEEIKSGNPKEITKVVY